MVLPTLPGGANDDHHSRRAETSLHHDVEFEKCLCARSLDTGSKIPCKIYNFFCCVFLATRDTVIYTREFTRRWIYRWVPLYFLLNTEQISSPIMCRQGYNCFYLLLYLCINIVLSLTFLFSLVLYCTVSFILRVIIFLFFFFFLRLLRLLLFCYFMGDQRNYPCP